MARIWVLRVSGVKCIIHSCRVFVQRCNIVNNTRSNWQFSISTEHHQFKVWIPNKSNHVRVEAPNTSNRPPNFKCTIQCNLTIQERTKWRWKYEIWLYIALMILFWWFCYRMVWMTTNANVAHLGHDSWPMSLQLVHATREYIYVPNKCVCARL